MKAGIVAALLAWMVAGFGVSQSAPAKDWDDIEKDRRRFVEKQQKAERKYWEERRKAEREYWKDVREWQKERDEDWWDDDQRRGLRFGFPAYQPYYNPAPYGYAPPYGYGGYVRPWYEGFRGRW